METLIDLTQTIRNDMPVYPGDAATLLHRTKQFSIDGYTSFRLESGMHAGTHLDGPMHMTESQCLISDWPLEQCLGIGCVLDVRNEPSISFKTEYETQIQEGSIVLLYTGWDQQFGTAEYFTAHPVVAIELAEFLVERKIKMVGVDFPSPDKPPFAIHQLLLSNHILILENLTRLDRLLAIPKFELMAFPLKIAADSSMLRVVAREL